MTIIRNGEEFELTAQELLDAYDEQQELFDIETVKNNLDCLDEEFYERFKDDDNFLASVAGYLRDELDDGIHFDYSIGKAFNGALRDFAN